MISGDSKTCAISTEKGCTGCNWSEDDKIGLGNCETVTKNHFDFSFKTQLCKARWIRNIKDDLVQKKIKFIEDKINYAFLKSDRCINHCMNNHQKILIPQNFMIEQKTS